MVLQGIPVPSLPAEDDFASLPNLTVKGLCPFWQLRGSSPFSTELAALIEYASNPSYFSCYHLQSFVVAVGFIMWMLSICPYFSPASV